MRLRAALITGLGLFLIGAGAADYLTVRRAAVLPNHPEPASDYDTELSQIDRQMSLCDQLAQGEQRATRLAFLRFLRASIAGDVQAYRPVKGAIDDAVLRFGPSADLCLLRASLELKFHHLAEARAALDALPAVSESQRGAALLADIDFQEGRVSSAGAVYRSLAEAGGSWEALARCAYFQFKTGDLAGAERTFTAAAESVTVKDLRSYAWVELQRGQMLFATGRFDDAANAYGRAGRAYSGYWLTDEYQAELLAARKRFDESVGLYERVIGRTPRPEIAQELGDLFQYMGKLDSARLWHERALAGYLVSVARGEVQYLHHLVGYYTDAEPDPSRALEWAQKDLRLRDNYATEDSLAWALHKAGRHQEAAAASARALSAGVVDTHVLFHAAMIRMAVGDAEQGRKLLGRLAEINPRYQDFHAHR